MHYLYLRENVLNELDTFTVPVALWFPNPVLTSIPVIELGFTYCNWQHQFVCLVSSPEPRLCGQRWNVTGKRLQFLLKS